MVPIKKDLPSSYQAIIIYKIVFLRPVKKNEKNTMICVRAPTTFE